MKKRPEKWAVAYLVPNDRQRQTAWLTHNGALVLLDWMRERDDMRPLYLINRRRRDASPRN